MKATSTIELSKSALKNNIRFVQSQIGTQCRICSVIKGNAYGHGIKTFLPMAESLGIDRFAVFDASEALAAQRARQNPATELIIMGALPDDALGWAIEEGIQFYVFDLPRLQAAINVAKQTGRPARIHLELETGMWRTGLANQDLDQALQWIDQEAGYVKLEGVCTHLAGAESITNYYRIEHQIRLFQSLTHKLFLHGTSVGSRHAACSAALIKYPETHFDMVRCGIMQFGFWPSPETRMHHILNKQNGAIQVRQFQDPLRRVMRWKSWVMGVKSVDAGTYIGYGNTFMSTKPMTLAMIPVGYYHGYCRGLSNAGHVLIRGKRCGVVGTVNMNMMTVDSTHLQNLQVGEEVVIIGNQRRNRISVRSFSEMSQYLNYEVLVRIPSDIPRIVTS